MEIRQPYKACFLLPLRTDKLLTDCGWEFKSTHRIPDDVFTVLIQKFNLAFNDHALNIKVYEGENLKASALFDDQLKIIEIYMQIWSDEIIAQLKAFFQANKTYEVELFFPYKPINTTLQEG